MDRRAPGEVERSALPQPATVDPLEDGDEHEQHPGRREDRPRTELHPVRDRAGDQGRRDHGEHPEERDHREREPAVLPDSDPVEEGGAEAPEEVVVSRFLCQRVAHDHPQDRNGQQAPEVHHEHVQDVAAAIHPAVEQREARRHEQHEGRGDQQPGSITRIHDVLPLTARRRQVAKTADAGTLVGDAPRTTGDVVSRQEFSAQERAEPVQEFAI